MDSLVFIHFHQHTQPLQPKEPGRNADNVPVLWKVQGVLAQTQFQREGSKVAIFVELVQVLTSSINIFSIFCFVGTQAWLRRKCFMKHYLPEQEKLSGHQRDFVFETQRRTCNYKIVQPFSCSVMYLGFGPYDIWIPGPNRLVPKSYGCCVHFVPAL